MNIKSLKQNILFVVLAFVFVFTCVFFVDNVYAEEENLYANAYYYNTLKDESAKSFYKAIAQMESAGILQSGNQEFDLLKNGYVTQNQIENYQNGDVTVLKDFGAGRDAYMFDTANNFYTDFDKLSISFGLQNGKYIATLGTGRTDSYYIAGGFENKEVIDEQKLILSQRVEALVGDVSELDDYQKITKANKIIIENTQ